MQGRTIVPQCKENLLPEFHFELIIKRDLLENQSGCVSRRKFVFHFLVFCRAVGVRYLHCSIFLRINKLHIQGTWNPPIASSVCIRSHLGFFFIFTSPAGQKRKMWEMETTEYLFPVFPTACSYTSKST